MWLNDLEKVQTMDILEIALDFINTADPMRLLFALGFSVIFLVYFKQRKAIKEQENKSKDRDIELAEIKARATDQDNWFRTFSGIMEAIGRLDTNMVEGDKATAKGLNLTSESIRHLTATLQETNRGVATINNNIATLDGNVKTVGAGVKQIQSDTETLASKVAETLRDDFEQIGNRLDTLTTLVADNKDTERKEFIRLSGDLKSLVDRALPVLKEIVDDCKDKKESNITPLKQPDKQPEPEPKTDDNKKEEKAS